VIVLVGGFILSGSPGSRWETTAEASEHSPQALQTEPGAAASDLAIGSTGLFLLGDDEMRFRLGAGVFDPLEIGGEKHNPGSSFVGHAAIHPGFKFLYVEPSLGLFVNSDGGIYGYLGLSADLEIGPFRLTPMGGFGGYEPGDSKDLGGVFEFLISGTLTFPLGGGWRAGVSYVHLSNGDLHDRNPGTEMILGILEIPIFR
jgi:hypothetical protein